MMELDNCPCSGANLPRFVQPVILAVLFSGPLHGYLVVQRLAETSLFRKQPPDATGVYRMLRNMEQEGVLTPLSELHCRFLAPAGYEDRLLVETRMTRLTPARVQFEYRVLREGEQTPLCLGYTLHGFVSRELRPYNLKKARPELFAKFQACLEESLF